MHRRHACEAIRHPATLQDEHIRVTRVQRGNAVQVVVDVDDLTDTANLLIILFAIVAPFSIAFRYFMKAKNKYYLYKARHADTLVQHTHSTNRGAPSFQPSFQFLAQNPVVRRTPS